MIKPLDPLQALGDIALSHASSHRPDLATMAADLCGHARLHAATLLNEHLAHVRDRHNGYERWLLARRDEPGISVLVMVWPANYATAIHDHDGLWGMELTLQGALEVESWERDVQTGQLRQTARDWIGPCEASWFDANDHYAHRCRNLSRHESAVTLHVYGGDLAQYSAYEQTEGTGPWLVRAQRPAITGVLRD